VLALTAALVGPHFVDWSNYKADFEREAGHILGREVSVRGEATARLLPFPSVTFTDVAVAGTTPGEPAMTVETFSMDAELAPFMRGELLIFDMRIVRPRARLAIAEDGTVDWALRPSAPIDPRQVKLEKVTITEGRIDIAHASSGQVHTLTEINTEVVAQTLAGPWRIGGTARVNGHVTALTVSTGAAENGRMRLRVHAEPEIYAFVADSDGEVSLEGGALAYEGTFKLAAKQAEPATAGAPVPPPAYRTSGKFSIDHSAVKVSEFRLETGPLVDPYTADGRAEISFGEAPRFTVVADGAQLRFEDGEAGTGAGIALAQRLQAFRAAVLALPRPEIEGSITLNLPAIVAGDTTVREVVLSAEPVPEGWRIDALRAVLPGRATLDAAGVLSTDEDDFGFRGRMLLGVQQPSGFAAWLSNDVDEAIRRLDRAGFDAEVDLTQTRQVFEKLELNLGGATFRGRIVNEQATGQRGSMTLDLAGDRLDLDGLDAFAALFLGADGTARLGDHNFDIALNAGPVTVGGLTAARVDTRLTFLDQTLDIYKLTVDGLEGASLAATGELKDIGGDVSGNLDVTVVDSDLGPLVAKAAERLPDQPLLAALAQRVGFYPGLLDGSDLTAKATFSGPQSARSLDVTLAGVSGGSSVDATLNAHDFSGSVAEATLSLSFGVSNEEPAALYALAGLPGLPLGFAGPATFEAQIDGRLADGAQAELALRGEGLEATFAGPLTVRDGRLGATGDMRLSTPDLEPWLMTAGFSLPGMGLGLPVELAGSVDIGDSLAVVSGLTGSVAGNAISGDVNAQMRDGRPHLTGALQADLLDLALAAEALFGEAAFQAGSAEWPQTPFQPAATPSFTGELELGAALLKAGAVSARNAQMTARLDKDGLRVFDLSGQMLGGTISGLFELANNSGTGIFSGQLTLDGAALPELLPASGLLGTGRFTAALTANGKSVDGMVASLAGSGTASLSGLSIDGLRSDAFAELIAAADAVGPKIDSAATAGFAPAIVSGGRFDAGSVELALSIAGGVARAPALRAERPDAILTVEPRFDLTRWQAGASGSIEYAAGDEAVAGGNPAVRFAATGRPGAITGTYDTEPLAQYLTQRALEKEQARVEAMQAVLLERQRLRREVRYYASLADERVRQAEQARLAAEAEASRLAAEEAARRALEVEAARQAAEESARRAQEATTAREAANEAARLATQAEDAAQRAAEAERRAIEDAQRRQAEEAARQRPAQQPDTGFLPGVDRQPLGPAVPRTGDGTTGSLFRPGTLNFGQAAGVSP
jgi:uncharacterized protein involved in outer membrane biogenesis